MKLLHVAPTLNPQSGGTVTAIRQLVAARPDLQEIVCLDQKEAEWLGSKDSLSGAVHALGHQGGLYSYSPALVPWLQAEAGRFDFVIVHGLWQYQGLGVWRALKNSSTPYAVFPHGMLDPWFQKNYPRKHLKKLIYWHLIESRVLSRAARILYTAEEEREEAHRSFSFPKARESIAPLGLARPEGKTGGLGRTKTLLYLGRLDPKKGVDLLLEAFAHTMKGSEWRLVIAGPDSIGWKNELLTLSQELGVAGQLEWPGMLQGEEKSKALLAAEALVLPSHQENFGLAVVEALAVGLPVLISNRVNIWREIVQDGAGFASSDDLAGTIELLQKWKSLDDLGISRMQAAAHECFVQRYEIGRAYEHLVMTLRSSLA